MIRVVIAEDQKMVLGALAALLEIGGDIDVVGRAQDGESALTICRELKPDVLLTDIEMPRMTGLELAAAVKREALGTRIIILTTFARGGYLRLSDGTVRNYLSEAISKLGAGNRVEAARIAREKGWL